MGLGVTLSCGLGDDAGGYHNYNFSDILSVTLNTEQELPGTTSRTSYHHSARW